ncbi:MAG: hypothetical protein WC203_07270 [Candidatus Bathyarchaeia archaeon]|nr:hypothetical protein [Thermoproteota archaeon]MDT8782399.1 hypothetical protein [Candidatus Bathyarchaeota archaeon]NLD66632.1 hypothetical protein [Thermoproteota archaeon]
MNRKLLVIFSIIIVVVLFVGLVVYSWYVIPQDSQPEAQARIADITADTSFKGCLVGVTTDIWFNVTVQNTGETDISGANVTVEISGVNDSSVCGYDNQSLGVLHVNEARQIKAVILTDISHFSEVAISNFTAKLIVNGTVWDEKTYYNLASSVVSTDHVVFFYHEGSRRAVGNNTQLFLVINATLVSGDCVTIDYSKFFLCVWIQSEDGLYHLMLWRPFDSMDYGFVTLNSVDRAAVFVLTFEFPTRVMGLDGYVVSFSRYSLEYRGQDVGVTIISK